MSAGQAWSAEADTDGAGMNSVMLALQGADIHVIGPGPPTNPSPAIITRSWDRARMPNINIFKKQL